MLSDRLLTNTFGKSDTFGVFNHYLYGDANWCRTTALFDVDRLARNLYKIGATRYCITLMQGRKYMLAPNSTYDKIAGCEPGDACCTRDLPMLIGRALEKYGIDLYLYYTGDGPYLDSEIGPKFGITEPRKITPEFVEKWSAVLVEYSSRYGSLVKGWWIDGCYSSIGYTETLLAPLYDACKQGNPDAIVAMNEGVFDQPIKYYSKAEYTCGEFNDFNCVPEKGLIDGARAHILAPLGVSPDGSEWGSWAKSGLKRDAVYLSEYIRKLHDAGCALTIDMIIYPDGTFDVAQFNELCKLSDMIRK